MKKLLLIIPLLIACLTVKAQAGNAERKAKVKQLVKDMYYTDLPAGKLSKKYFDTTLGTTRDSLATLMFNWAREDSLKLKWNGRFSDVKILPYKAGDKRKGHLGFYNVKAGSEYIYQVEKGGAILMHVLVKDQKIASFITMSKGRKDWSYFIII